MTLHKPLLSDGNILRINATASNIRQQILASKSAEKNAATRKRSTSVEKMHSKNSGRKSPQQQQSRKPLFLYPALPRAEMALCFAVIIGALFYAWWCVFRVSQKWATRIVDASTMSHLPYFGWRFKDEINWEWYRWSPMALSYLPYLVGHSIVFSFAHIFLAQRKAAALSTVFSVFSSVQIFGAKLVVFSILQGCFLFACTLYSRRTVTVWVSALPSLYVIMNHSSLLSDDIFHVLLYASYTMLSYISFCLDWARGEMSAADIFLDNEQQQRTRKCDNEAHDACSSAGADERENAWQMLKRMFFYAFYQPYLFSLIVTYADFEQQYTQRPPLSERPMKPVIWRALRVAFWWALIELMLHFFYFESILHDENFFAHLPKNEFVTMGMAVGAFFHLKYVVIFGLPAVFALADGMRPPAGSICISRVALYSKIWRGFDRGLYAFFKAYIFLPICAPTFTPTRRILGVLVSYLFVLIWHGFHHQNLVWIGLNIVELFLEYGAKYVYSIEAVHAWRERHLSDMNFRRFLGAAQIVPFAFGLYSNFYFLGGSRVGWLFVRRIFLEETVTLRWPFFLLIFIGYFYMQVTMEFERYYGQQPQKEQRCPLAKYDGAQTEKYKKK